MTLTAEIRLAVPGHPIPKGSLKCVGRGNRHQLVEDNARTKEWRALLVYWIRRAWPAHQHADPRQPVGADVTFVVPRPAGHYGTGRNADRLKPSAPTHPSTHGTGDVDKLVRLVLDALQDAAVLVDDAQIVDVNTRKRYPTQPGDDETLDPDLLHYPGVAVRLYPIRNH